MTVEQFREQYAIALSIVAKWPAWKRGLLEQSARPTVAVPRTPIIHQPTLAEWQAELTNQGLMNG